MILKTEKLHLKKLLADAIPLLCKNGLPLHSMFRVEAMIGITVDESEVALICFKETVTSDGELLPQVYGVDEDIEETDEHEEFGELETGNNSAVTAEECDEPGSQVCSFKNNNRRSYNHAFGSNEASQFIPAAVKIEDNGELEIGSSEYDISGQADESGGYVYDGELYENAGFDTQPSVASRSENRRSFAAGSDQQFIKEEVDLGVNDCMFIKEEQGIDSTNYEQSFSIGHRIGSTQGKTKSVGRRGHNVYPEFSHHDKTALQHYPTWQRKTKTARPAESRRIAGSGLSSGKVPRNMMPVAGTDIRSKGSTPGYASMIQGLCDSILQQSAQNGDQFVCHICEAKLSNATTLRNHIRGTHLALKTERCNICGESFKWAMQLARHKKRDHGDGSFIQIYNTAVNGVASNMDQEGY